jgi:hypothetical protein
MKKAEHFCSTFKKLYKETLKITFSGQLSVPLLLQLQ